MNLSHTLARNETTNQHTSREILLQQKLNILHQTTDKRGIEGNKMTRKQKDGSGK